MFQPIDSSQEKAIVAGADKPRKSKSKDTSIRTVTAWFTHIHQIGENCTVPSHESNVPNMLDGKPYDKSRRRPTMQIGPYRVCRWCFIAEADLIAEMEGLDPVE